MQRVVYYLITLMLFQPLSVFCQSVFVPINADYYHLVDRYEIKSGQLSNTFHTNIKPFLRKDIVALTHKLNGNPTLSKVDEANLKYLQDDSWEYLTEAKQGQANSEKPLFTHFFEKKSDFYSFQNNAVDIHLSPIFQFGYGTDNLSKDSPFTNTRGIEIRGTLNSKLGFYTQFTENQIVYPYYVRQFIKQSQGFPYEGFTKVIGSDSTKMGADFIAARGYITFKALKNLTLMFGQDKNFVGSGIRSLILSDFAAPYLQLKTITTVGRVQYVNVFAQMVNRQLTTPGDSIIPPKYMAFHHLNVNIGRNLNIGVFETVMFGKRPMGFDLNYLNPLIFYRYVEGNIGSGDNSVLGFDFKYNFLRKASVYGQVLLDEWIGKHIFAQDGYVGNKYALQLGGKYIDVLGIQNLDFQAEYNLIRPYTYSHFSTYSNMVNYNLPLAHPLGANLKEIILTARYQPLPKLFLNVNYSCTQKGEDNSYLNWGGNVLRLYVNRPLEFGNEIGQGRGTSIYFFDISANYMLKHNLFIDLHYQNRSYQSQNSSLDYKNNNLLFGIRWNIPQRSLMF